MDFFDFHHHKKYQNGIYTLNPGENIPTSPFSAGIHPKNIDDNAEDNFNRIKEITLNNNCWAIGECGLDGLISVNEKIQEEVFEKHILWANEIRKPVIIHCVRRFSEMMKFIKIAGVPMIIHGFNKKKNTADQLLQAGFYLSFGKAVLQNVSLQALVKDFPAEKMFLETDDADFNIEILYQKVSELKKTTPESLQNQILENLERIRNL